MQRQLQLTWVCTVALTLFLSACSSKNEFIVKPAPLPDFDSSIDIKKLWSVSLSPGYDETYVKIHPAVTEQYVYAANVKGVVIAVERETGKKLWRIKTKKAISAGVTAAYGMVLFGTIEGEVVALNAETGETLWTQHVSSEILAAPAMDASAVVVQTVDGQLFGLDRKSGESLWQFDTSVPILTLRGDSNPMIVNGAAIAGFASGQLVAVDIEKGVPLWERQVGIPQGRSELERLVDLDGSVALHNNTIYAVTFQGNVAALDLYTGRSYWQREASSYVALDENNGKVFVADSDGYLMSLDEETGATEWQIKDLRARALSSVATLGDYVLVGDFQGYLHWINQKSGQFAGRIRVDSEGLRVKPIVKNDVAYVFGNSGKLMALALKTEK